MDVLIIKTGHTETFDTHILRKDIVSLGDVLRTTVILHLFKNDRVTWLTSQGAMALLENNPFIHHLETDPRNLSHKTFDLVVNFERLPLLSEIQNSHLVGHDENNVLVTSAGTFDLESWLKRPEIKQMNWSQKLFSLFGKVWNNENYLLFPIEKIEATYDLGLNWKVGPKWPSKSWPQGNWEEIHRRVKNDYIVSFQEGFDDLRRYITWIQSCKTLLTHDSLGLHIGLALGKSMVALMGPTLSTEIPFVKTKILSLSEDPSFACPPCYEEQCRSNIHCVSAIKIDTVETEIRNILRETDEQYTIGWKQALTPS